MRFSSIFSLPFAPPQPARPQPVRAPEPTQRTAQLPAAPVLPDDLDQRVRLVGEWQLGEAA